MSERPSVAERPKRRGLSRAEWTLAGVTALLMLAMVLGYWFWFRIGTGPVQPIPFSHRLHATDKQISCFFCHNGAVNTARAGVPPLETCLLCHSRIITEYPQIVKLRDYYRRREPIPWVRVNDVPGFVYFSHQRHLLTGIDCAQCHGDVAHMDRVQYLHRFEMGYCMQCHRDYNASHDCYTCHR